MENTMDKKTQEKFGTVFQKWMKDPEFEKELDAEIKDFALSELLFAIMDENKQSVRKLAEMAGISPSSLQDLRSGKSKDVKLKNFVSIVEACGYGIEIVKGNKRIPLHPS